MSNVPTIDIKAAEDHLMRFLAIDGVTGQEAAIAAAVADALKKIGVPASAIRFDDANKRIPVPTQTGNLYVDLPGTRSGQRLLFATHLDTVPLCAGAKPRIEGKRIVSDGTTALGGDNRTGCALLVSLAETLLKQKLPHPPITLLFTVREESGLHGARELDPKDLGGAKMCFNVDGQLASELITGAVGQVNWEAEIFGKASHAGVAPERGISATLGGGPGTGGGTARRLVRQGRQEERPWHQQPGHLWRKGRQGCRRRHQCCHRLCLCQRRGEEPGREVRRIHRRRVPRSFRQGRQDGEGRRRRDGRGRISTQARPIPRST